MGSIVVLGLDDVRDDSCLDCICHDYRGGEGGHLLITKESLEIFAEHSVRLETNAILRFVHNHDIGIRLVTRDRE